MPLERSHALMGAFAAEVTRLMVDLRSSPFHEKVAAFERLKGDYLQKLKNPALQLEIRRRVAEALIREALKEPWAVLRTYLRRLTRLGYSSPDTAVWVGCTVARLKNKNAEARRFALTLLKRAERMLKAGRFAAAYRAEQEDSISGARAHLLDQG
jgi:hypothetical protein